jgi:hypothetical protein
MSDIAKPPASANLIRLIVNSTRRKSPELEWCDKLREHCTANLRLDKDSTMH